MINHDIDQGHIVVLVVAFCLGHSKNFSDDDDDDITKKIRLFSWAECIVNRDRSESVNIKRLDDRH